MSKEHTPSSYQQAIYSFIANEAGNAIVEAVAGSGKTSTIVESLNLVPKNKRTLFVAFNKHIAEELERRVPPYVEARTLHSVGFSIMKSRLGNYIKVNGNKTANILKYKMFDMNDKKSAQKCFKVLGACLKLTSLLKAYAIRINDFNSFDWEELAEKQGINIPEGIDDFDQILESCFLQSVDVKGVIDYDDMIYWPTVNDVACPQYDMIFVDESQDLNPVQMQLVMKLMGQSGRLIAVGDSRQAIYGFRGADPEAMQTFGLLLQAKKLPLSICYRCGTKIVEAAKEIVPQIEPSPAAKEGEVTTIDKETFLKEVKSHEYVLCRVTADLVTNCLKLIQKGKKAMVRGRDIGEGLKDLVGDLNLKPEDDYDIFRDKLQAYRMQQSEKLKYKELELIAMQDRVDTLDAIGSAVWEECCSKEQPMGDGKPVVTVREIVSKIDTIFSDVDDGVIFSTVHKSKGLEAPVVYILRPDLIPHPKAEKEWQQTQEMNLKYVAITRAREKLIWVTE